MPERRPAILAVDDEPAVLSAVAHDLRREFGERYRILRAQSGPEALDLLRQVRARGDQVALLIADADTEAAIAAIDDVALDSYLLKPWDPPEEQLFPVVEDLLTTWEAGAAREPGGVRVVGHRFSVERGTGLGLATARQIVVDRHGGSLTVDSPPAGTTFHVWIPVRPPEAR